MFIYGAPKHRIAYIIPCYNVANNVHNLIPSMVEQTIKEPIDIIFSDHGSWDGTFGLFKQAYKEYGPKTKKTRHNVCVFKATRNTFGATIGAVHDHINQLMMAIDNEFIIMGTGDDIEYKDRARKLVEAYDKTGAGFITNSQRFIYPKETGKQPTVSRGTGITRFIDIEETVVQRWDHPSLNGSSAWSKELWREFGPLDLHAANDIIMPLWGCLGKGTFHIGGVYKDYFVTGNQTGLGSRYQFMTDLVEKAQAAELMCFERQSLAMQVRTLVAQAIQKTIYQREALRIKPSALNASEKNNAFGEPPEPTLPPIVKDQAEYNRLSVWLERLNRCYAIATETVVLRSEEWSRCRATLVAHGIKPHDYKFKMKRDNKKREKYDD